MLTEANADIIRRISGAVDRKAPPETQIQQAISVFKKRGGPHERTLRQFTMDQQGMRVGKVLRGYRGLLTGVPVQLRGGEGDAG